MRDDVPDTLCDICSDMYDITLSESFPLLSVSDQRNFNEIYGRLKRRLNRAGYITAQDHFEGMLDADAEAQNRENCISVGAMEEDVRRHSMLRAMRDAQSDLETGQTNP